MNKLSFQQDCTPKCRSVEHGALINAAITKRSISDQEISSYSNFLCCCCETVQDLNGRTALHVAASCGRTELVRWLIESRNASINAKDRESAYTALHRSIFYGKIDTVVELVKLGANVGLQDGNGLTYLDHAIEDRFIPLVNSVDVVPLSRELFSWGTNSNNSLGSQPSRQIPESMDIFHKEYPNEEVQKILINEFHSVILTHAGSVYCCGHGLGGRLGLGIQYTEVIPKLVKFPSSASSSASNLATNSNERIHIISCSIAKDHSLFLSSSGEVYACGLNKHRVLGINPPPEEILEPKIVLHLVEGTSFQVASGNYHSLVWSEKGIFSWGLHAGQLGHQLTINHREKYIITPKKIKLIDLHENTIKLVSSSTGATTVYTQKGDVYVLHEYQCRKIASRQLNLIQLSIIGGTLNHSLDKEISSQNKELKVAALTNVGNLFLWRETDPVLRRCIFSVNRTIKLKDVTLNNNQILFVTGNGEVFSGEPRIPRKKPSVPISAGKDSKSEFHKFIQRDECVNVKLERIPRVFRALSIHTDPKGHNFGVVQDRPYKCFNRFEVADSTMLENLTDLLFNSDLGISDIEFKVSEQNFAAHRYILASRSAYFANLFAEMHRKAENIIVIQGYHPAVFREFLRYIYTGNCDLIELGILKNKALIQLCAKREPVDLCLAVEEQQQQNFENPVRMLHEMAKRFELIELQKSLTNLDMLKKRIILKKHKKPIMEKWKRPVTFNRHEFPEYYDVEILCKNTKIVKAHKCILTARLDYFNNMFSARWSNGSKKLAKINLEFSQSVVEALLDFLYTDSLQKLNEEKDLDQLFKIIILADQLFVDRLKDQCEIILSGLLTIKNAIQLLTFSDHYNARNLKENCFQFLQQNMTTFLELRLLEDVESTLLKEFSEFYQIQRNLNCRIITPFSTAVNDEEIQKIHAEFPIDMNEKFAREKLKFSKNKRVRNHKNSGSQIIDNEIHNDSLKEVLLEAENSSSEEKLHPESSTMPLTPSRLKSILNATTKLTQNDDDFYEFPLLLSPLKPQFQLRSFERTETTASKQKFAKLSQKQRKKLSLEENAALSPPQMSVLDIETISPKNPWNKISQHHRQDSESPINSPPSINNNNNNNYYNIDEIISSEKKQKEQLIKITSKQLIYTQIEDKAMEELKKFYNVDLIEEELIIVERVPLMGAVAVPIWVPKTR